MVTCQSLFVLFICPLGVFASTKTLPAVAWTRAVVASGASTLEAMLVTNHVLSGALIGATVNRPSAAFTLGVASHFVLDTMPHWGKWGSRSRFMRVAVPDGLTGLAAMAAFAAVSPPERRLAVLAGMAGAALPDLDKPSIVWFGRSPFPRVVDRFHASIQHEAEHRAGLEFTAAAVFGAAALTLLRKRR
jgi:hypothetical protein